MCLACEQEAMYSAWLEWQAQQKRANAKPGQPLKRKAKTFSADVVSEDVPSPRALKAPKARAPRAKAPKARASKAAE